MRNRFNLLLNKESDISRIAATGFIWLAKRATQYNDSQPATSPVKRSGRLSAAKERGKLMKWTIAKSLPQKSGFTSGHAGAGIALPGGKQEKRAFCREYNASVPQANVEAGTGSEPGKPMLLRRGVHLGIQQ
jgi:hypothetical protein